ncbi:hypothetical protein DMUE_5276 [Dictyocoela muelleri]|nr:hypothetical protein DMUE_5276 [Dictyocoela muelleri]
MAVAYKEELNFKKTFKFFLIYHILNLLEYIRHEFILSEITVNDYSEILFEFIQYYGKTFFGTNDCNPLFSHDIWSVFYRIRHCIPTTINTIEGWHCGFNKLVGTRNPNLGRFIDAIRQETEKTRHNISRYKSGDFDLVPKNHVKLEKLKIYVENEEYMNIEDIFCFLNKINSWSFED